MTNFFLTILKSNLVKMKLFIFIILPCLTSCNSPKISFEKIEYASFRVLKSEDNSKDSISILLYSIMNNSGLVKIRNNDDYHDTLTFYTYQLNKGRMSEISQIFNSQKKLDDYFVTKKQADSAFYGGVYHFLKVVYENGQEDSVCFIPPFMSAKFNAVFNMLNDEVYFGQNNTSCNPFNIPEIFKTGVLLNYKKSTYLPEVKQLPSFKPEDQ